MNQSDTRPVGLTDDEWRLLRLFRCMDAGERDRTLIEAATSLFHCYRNLRCRWSFEDILEYLRQKQVPWSVEDVKGHLLAIRPADWPDRRFVDLTVFPDPGAAMAETLPEWFCYTVLGGSVLDDDAASDLVRLYLKRCSDRGVTLPTGCDTDDKDPRAGLRADFLGFIREWRERAMTTIEEEAVAPSRRNADRITPGRAASGRPPSRPSRRDSLPTQIPEEAIGRKRTKA